MDKNWAKNTLNIDLEITTMCNVGCIACARINNNHVDKTFQNWQKFFREDLADINFQRMTFTSYWGDPLGHPEFLDMVRLLLELYPDITLEITTSLNYGDEDFYTELGETLEQFWDARVLTYVYGTGDYHTFFRKNADFERVKTASRVLSREDVKVYWKMPQFKYNQEDFDNVLAAAEDCDIFQLQTVEYHNGEIFNKPDSRDGNEKVMPWLEAPVDPVYEIEDWGNYPFVDPIKNKKFEDDCQSLYNRSVWIDTWGGVWPCYALGKYTMDVENPDGLVLEGAIEQYGYFNNLNKNKLIDILNHKWYKQDLPTAQSVNPWKVCRRECGVCGTTEV